MKIIFAGGGTAGHVTPSLAVAEALIKEYPGSEAIFVGRRGGKENESILSRAYELHELDVRGISRSAPLSNLSLPYKVARAVRECELLIKTVRPDAIFATGGYVSYPALKAGYRLGVPCYIHESNAEAGVANRLMSKKCEAVFLGSRAARSLMKLKQSVYVGNPTLGDFGRLDRRRMRRELGIGEDEIFIVSVGGSLGAEALNEAVICVMKEFSAGDPKIKHIHASGCTYFERIKENEPSLVSPRAKSRIVPYITEMARYLAAADIAITRAGALTLSELMISGVASIVIPSPNVSSDHQRKNAQTYLESGAIIMLNESPSLSGELIASLRTLVKDKEQRTRLSIAARSLSTPDAARKILEIIANNAKG